MVFNISAVAGPSRLPLFSRAAYNVSRRCASGKAPADEAVDAEADAEASVTSTSDVAPQDSDDKKKGPLGPGYAEWLAKVAEQYKEPRNGQRATWLGGSIPFPGNPSFRPPPPLSNDLQDLIYQRKHRGDTIGQISSAFGISKARIEAVVKLKDVEQQLKRDNNPLQTAFLAGMEPLLGVKSPLRNQKPDVVTARVEQQERDDHPAGHVEIAEEERFEKGVGAGGAFGLGDLMPGHEGDKEGMERGAWEFREEGDTGFKPSPFNREPPVVAATGENLAPTIEHDPEVAPKTKTRVSAGFRFVDMSEASEGPFSDVNQKMHARKRAAKLRA